MKRTGLLIALMLMTPLPALADGIRAELAIARDWGNTDTEKFAGKVEASADAVDARHYAEASGVRGKTDGTVTSSRWALGGRYEQDISGRLFAFGAADFLRDTYAGYDARYTVGPGLGYAADSGAHSLKGLLSVIYSLDLYAGGGSDAYGAVRAGGNYTWQVTELLQFKQSAGISSSLENVSTYFADSETALELGLSEHLALGVSYTVNYQNDPPGGAEHVDSAFLTSLVVNF